MSRISRRTGTRRAEPATFDAVLRAWQDEMSHYHYYWPVYVVYGQAPS